MRKYQRVGYECVIYIQKVTKLGLHILWQEHTQSIKHLYTYLVRLKLTHIMTHTQTQLQTHTISTNGRYRK